MPTEKEFLADIKKLAAGYIDEQLEVLKKLAGIDCQSGNIEGNRQVAAIIENLLKGINGLKVIRQTDEKYGTALIGILNPAAAGKLVLNAHLDTVYNSGDCAAHPCTISADRIAGLGVADCKGGVITAIYAVKLLQQIGFAPDRQIMFIFNPDEEVGSPFGQQVFARYAYGADYALVFEPARDDDGIITARKAAARFKIEVSGVSAHSGVNYQAGASAVVQLAHSISVLNSYNDENRNIFFNLVELNGGGRSFGVVPEYASVSGSVRIGDQSEIDYVKDVLAKVEKDIAVPHTSVKAALTYTGTPMTATTANLALYEKARSVGAAMGMDLSQQKTGGGSDASYFSAMGIATIDALGPHMFAMHSFNEAASIPSISQRTALAAGLIAVLTCGK